MEPWRTHLDGTMSDLTRRVRVKALEHFEPGILPRCERLKLVERVKVFGRPPFPVHEPLWTGDGTETPDCEKLAYQASRRLPEPREFVVWKASQRAVNVFAGRYLSKINVLQIGHDVQLASVLEAFRQAGRRTDLWVGEDRLEGLRQHLTKVPDAFVLTDPPTVIEYVGDYPASRIEAFVRSFSGYGFNIELW